MSVSRSMESQNTNGVQLELFDSGLGRCSRINLWIPDQGPDWKLEMEFSEIDLTVLLAYRMMDRWDAKLTAVASVNKKSEKEKAEKFLERFAGLARLPAGNLALVADGDFGTYSSGASQADLNIFSLPEDLDPEYLWSLRDATGSSCIFSQDSGDESALA